MANEIALQKVLEDYGAALEAQMPIVALANTDLSDKFGDSQGESVFAKIRNYGTTHQTTDLTGKMSDIKTEGVPLTLLPWKKGASLSFLENTLEVGGDIDAVIRDWSGEMADTLGKHFYSTALLGAATSHVSTGTFADLGVISNHVKKAGMAGSVGGMLSFDINTLVCNSGQNQSFAAAPSLSSKMYQGVIGSFRGVNYIEGRTDLLEVGGIFPAGSVTVNGSGVAHFTPSASVGTAITVKKGTVVTLAGVYAVDIFGKTTGVLRSFVVQADVTIPTGLGGVDVDFGEIIFAGPRKNVSVAAISAVALTNKFEANSVYASGVVFAKDELMIGMKGIKPLRTNSSTLKSVDGLPIRVTYEGSAKTSTEDMIFDVLAGSSVYARRASSAIYTKVS